MEKKKWAKVGTVRKSDKTGDFYIKFEEDISLKKGAVLKLDDPKKTLDRLAKLGYIKEGELEAKKAALPAWLKFEVILPPDRE